MIKATQKGNYTEVEVNGSVKDLSLEYVHILKAFLKNDALKPMVLHLTMEVFEELLDDETKELEELLKEKEKYKND